MISPAREPTVITVGASNIADSRWASSNWGGPLDIFAPGENVISLGITSPTVSIFHAYPEVWRRHSQYCIAEPCNHVWHIYGMRIDKLTKCVLD